MNNKVFAYIRVSSKEQNTGRQLEAIKEYCKNNNIELDERDIFTDKLSGKDFNRPAWQALAHTLRAGDTLIIKELDRLGRNKEQVKETLTELKNRGIRVKILNIPTTLMEIPAGQEWLLDTINNIVIELLGAIAEEERNKIKQRQAEGIEVAKAQGKKFGRPTAEYPENWEEVYKSWRAKEITAVTAFKTLEIPKATFYKLVKRYETEEL